MQTAAGAASPLNKGGSRGVAVPAARRARDSCQGLPVPGSRIPKTSLSSASSDASPVTKGGLRGVSARPSALLDTRIIYCGDCLDHASEPRPSGSGLCAPAPDRHAGTQAYIDYMRPRCAELARVLKKTGSFYYDCEWQDTTSSASLANRWS
jgi:hypothetical protein